MAAVGVLGTVVLAAAIRQGSKAVLKAVEVDVKRVGAIEAAASSSLGTVVLEAAILQGSKAVLKAVEVDVKRVGAIEAAASSSLGTVVLEAAILHDSVVVLKAVEVDVKRVGAIEAAASSSLGTRVLEAAIRKDSDIVLEEVDRVFEFKEGVPRVGAIEAAAKALGTRALKAASTKGSTIVAEAMAVPGIKLGNKVGKATQDKSVLQAAACNALQALVTQYTGDSAAADTKTHVDLLAKSNTQKDFTLIADIQAWLQPRRTVSGGYGVY
jgi:hypothetical protein